LCSRPLGAVTYKTFLLASHIIFVFPEIRAFLISDNI